MPTSIKEGPSDDQQRSLENQKLEHGRRVQLVEVEQVLRKLDEQHREAKSSKGSRTKETPVRPARNNHPPGRPGGTPGKLE
jgi:hypothetical protein